MRLNDLPEWQKLVRLIGDENAAALSTVYGGGRIAVPKFCGPHHPITEAVGSNAAAVIVAEFAGTSIDVPMTLGKRAQIVQLLQANVSVAKICRRVGVSRRHVFYVKDELRGGPGRGGVAKDQPDLFG
ncbi:helix-turn-helix domain-containing protein [Brevundimonas sp.]|uniref:helix-turn-helix domain-containing protein n=1 Tax=Brevundimonas sp. TaxID=1871086 RepID=UPI003512629E